MMGLMNIIIIEIYNQIMNLNTIVAEEVLLLKQLNAWCIYIFNLDKYKPIPFIHVKTKNSIKPEHIIYLHTSMLKTTPSNKNIFSAIRSWEESIFLQLLLLNLPFNDHRDPRGLHNEHQMPLTKLFNRMRWIIYKND